MNAVGIRELKNRLTHYVWLAKQGSEIVITEHGRPVALIQRLQDVRSPKTQGVQLAKLGAQGRLNRSIGASRWAACSTDFRGASSGCRATASG